ncbi:hypothetical protein UFOVP190_195 [uncultured Caudovirales phage]|uniref:Uncharacterized protein n=1 Tax=uncultured Caudovirales phage TaxID=2100421 RepID=A0A6J7WKI2_9CAUD|nr:hypothetical protein UFOVP190_195 [uncultured Caudovirales phage]
MNPDIIFIVGMIVLIASGFIVYKVISRARVKKLRAEINERWEREQEQARQARNMILDRDAALVARRAEARKVAELYRTPPHMMANNAVATSSVSAPAPAQQSSSMLRDAADIAVIANTFRHWNDNETPRHRSSSRDADATPAYVSSVTSSDDSSPSRSSYSSPSYSDDSSSSSSYSDSGSSSSSFD